MELELFNRTAYEGGVFVEELLFKSSPITVDEDLPDTLIEIAQAVLEELGVPFESDDDDLEEIEFEERLLLRTIIRSEVNSEEYIATVSDFTPLGYLKTVKKTAKNIGTILESGGIHTFGNEIDSGDVDEAIQTFLDPDNGIPVIVITSVKRLDFQI
jgi:hypothetical protein